MELEQAVAKFKDVQKTLKSLMHAVGIISFDANTVAPSDTAKGRGVTMGVLSQMMYEISTSEETGEAVDTILANVDKVDKKTAREAEFFNRDRDYKSKIPMEEYVEYTMLLNESEDVWHKAKLANDFESFRPYLEKVFETSRKFALYYKPDQDPYDTLLDQYEKGLSTKILDKFFGDLRAEIVPLLHKISEVPQIDDGFVHQNYPVYKQREFTDYLMQTMSIDRSHCNVGETEHPFTTGFNSNDIRITTHYHEDNLVSSMFSVIHEGGHALYELGVSDDLFLSVLEGGASMSIHESQSRFFENLIGRSRAFCDLIFPKVTELFPEQTKGVTSEDFYKAVNKAEPSLIRTEADELTYSLHIMIRYELEKAVLNGEVEVRDLPKAWNEKYKEYLGVDVPDDARGVLQDTHWGSGLIGYFPSYALGNAYGAQMILKMKEDFDVDEAVRSNNIAKIVSWLTERIYQYGCMYDPNEIIEMVCKAPFDSKYYIEYLKNKFTELYDLK